MSDQAARWRGRHRLWRRVVLCKPWPVDGRGDTRARDRLGEPAFRIVLSHGTCPLCAGQPLGDW